MTNVILFDNEVRERLLPLTYTRPVANLRIGILTIREKWERMMGGTVSYITQDYLADRYPIEYEQDNFLVNASALPSDQLCRLLRQMEPNEAFLHNGELIAARMDDKQIERLMRDEDIHELKGIDLEDTAFLKINHLWDIFRLNHLAIEEDFELITKGRVSQPLSPTNQLLVKERIFVEPGARVECSVLNATNGPIYIGKDAEVMEGCLVRGGLALCDGAVLKMGTKIYGATTIGPGCRIGGEVNNSVIQANSNKGHGGYLGNSILGEWCNLGASTNVSNLRNTYDEVQIWNYEDNKFQSTGLQFCGLIMGDHSKSGINTMFNTGTVVGVCANIFGSGFPPKHIPSFSWCDNGALQTYRSEKAFDMVERVMTRRDIAFDTDERLILLRILEDTAMQRSWENKTGL